MNNLFLLITQDQQRILTSDFIYKSLTVPEGFTFNGNSVPKWARFFLGQYDYIQASCVHDYLYSQNAEYSTTRYYADNIYREILINLGFKKYKANIAYICIRLFGKKFYKKG